MTPWVKLDNDYYDHQKFAAAGPLVELLWVRMLAWSHRNLTDGVVPVRTIMRLSDFLMEVGPIAPDQLDPYRFDGTQLTWRDLVDSGVRTGLFEPVDDTGAAYRIHGYCERQNTADLVAKRRDAGRRGGIRSGEVRQKWQPNEANRQANGKQTGEVASVLLEAEPKQTASKREASAQPDYRCQITDVETQVCGSLGATPEASPASDEGFDAFWDGYPKRNGKRIGKAEAVRVWKRMSRPERAAALLGVDHYRTACEAPDGQLAQDAHRWLTHKRWVDWQTPAVVTPRVNGSRSAVLARPGKLPLVESMARMASQNGQHQLPEVTG